MAAVLEEWEELVGGILNGEIERRGREVVYFQESPEFEHLDSQHLEYWHHHSGLCPDYNVLRPVASRPEIGSLETLSRMGFRLASRHLYLLLL